MPSAHNRPAKVVVRPLARGSSSARKVVLGTMTQLNRKVPVDDIRNVTPAKPWQQASRSFRLYDGKRRNAGRDDGRTWMARRYVCGAGLGPESEWSDEGGGDEEDEWEREVGQESGEWQEERRHGERAEVAIMDIAKPMRARGPTRDYEVVETVRRVIVLEDEDEEWEWDGDAELGKEDEIWESVEPRPRVSYATVVQRQVS